MRPLHGAVSGALLTSAASLGLLVLFWFLARAAELSPDYLTRDPAAVGNQHFLVGALSNLGVVVWTVAAAICGFSAALLWPTRSTRPGGRFLLCAGLLSAVLLLDDLFQIHEYAAEVYLGIPEPVVLGGYALLALAFLLAFRGSILRSAYGLLALSSLWFALSIALDQLAEETASAIFLEDSAKFLGITTWATFLVHAALLHAGQALGGADLHAGRQGVRHREVELGGAGRGQPEEPRPEALSTEA